MYSEDELAEFLRGYMEAAEFTDGGLASEDESREDCAAFMAANESDLDTYCDQLGDWQGSDTTRGADARYHALERAGADFWFSRNGHGAGYFDRGLGALGTRLQDAARVYGEVYIDSPDR